MSAQLQRYFAATAGGAIGVTWMTAGIGTALFTLATATCSYGAVVFHQRRRPVRRTRPVVRAARRRVPPRKTRGPPLRGARAGFSAVGDGQLRLVAPRGRELRLSSSCHR
jgi:hypothetical protein